MSYQKPPSLLRAILWVAGGVAVGYGSLIVFSFFFEHVGLSDLTSADFSLLARFFLGIGGLIGFAGYRRSCRKGLSELPKIQVSPAEPTPQPAPPAESRPKKTVFVSYRRDDSAEVTGRIYDRLSSRFGNDKVFKDVDSIPLGRDFRDVIGDAVAKASVVIVVIGRDWLGSQSDAELPRLFDLTDFVRTEVSTALEQGKPVIPVFVSNATMPFESELPDDIRDITYRNGINVRPDPDFTHDVERLIRGIEQT